MSLSWQRRQQHDPWVRKARQQRFRSRSAYKLLDIQQKFSVLRKGQRVVDLGAAPGSWSQVASQLVRAVKAPNNANNASNKAQQARVVACDRLPMASLAGVKFVQGSFNEPEVQCAIIAALNGLSCEVVLSDAAPDLSGIASTDQAAMQTLFYSVLALCNKILKKEGTLVIKLFQGAEFSTLRQQLSSRFITSKEYKPSASRSSSSEVYMVAQGWRSQE